MLPDFVRSILTERPDQDRLLELLAALSGRSVATYRSEILEHLAIRAGFLLLDEVSGASNYDIIADRVCSRFGGDRDALDPLISSLAAAISAIESSAEARRSGLRDIPYPIRRSILERQKERCGVCGWHFRDSDSPSRTASEKAQTLDHRVPYRIGGDSLSNLWVLCGLCNMAKEATLHVGEHGRVWSDNFLYERRTRLVAFWTFRRDGACQSEECNAGPTVSRLYAVRIRYRSATILDSMLTRCERHRSEASAIEY
jgi:5-methylcytosine-specific restriction endonuclease McrA